MTGTTGSESLLAIEGAAGKPFRVTGFTIDRPRTEDTDTYFIAIGGSALNWRVDHNKFRGAEFGSPDACVSASGRTYGVVDHCTFEGFARVTVFGDYFGDNHGWKEPLALGTADAVYVEDCTFDSVYDATPIFSNAIDSNGNGRWVLRYNDLTDRYAEAHGNSWGPGGRGTFSYEIYNNHVTDGPSSWVPVSVRGGTGVIHDNVFTGFVDGNLFNIYNDRSCRDDGPADGVCDTGDWTCNGSHEEDGNQVEGSGTHSGADDQAVLTAAGGAWAADDWKHCTVRNTTDGSRGVIDASTADTITATLGGGTDNDWDAGDAFTISCGYPCLDQIGRSTDASETAIQPQAAEPLYEWNNANDGEDTDIAPHDQFLLHRYHLREGRDYFNDTPRPGYVPYVHPHPVAAIGD
jgi:hypothetical protein